MPVSPREENFANGFDAINPAVHGGVRLGFRLGAARPDELRGTGGG